MHELVEKLEKEEGIKVDSLEVWHNPENEKRLLELDKEFCGGVPFFYNTKSNKWICGEASYKELKTWLKINKRKLSIIKEWRIIQTTK